MTDRLLAQVKRKLNITWSDPDTESRVQDIIESAIPTLIHKLGITDPNFDFAEPGMENNLFRAYCLYDWNHCVNEFDSNYSNDILTVRQKNDVAHYQANGGTADE